MGTNNPAQDGRNACDNNERRDSNPHSEGTPDFDAWQRGWDEAYQEWVNQDDNDEGK